MARTLLGVAVVLSCGLPLAEWSPAAAQEPVLVVTHAVGSGGSSGTVSRRSVERWAERLGFDADQRLAALALHEGYMSARQAAQQGFAALAQEAQRDADTATPGEVARRMMEARTRLNEQNKKIEEGFLDDFRSLLTSEQEERWPVVERMRRRELVGRHSTLSGDNIDLRRVIEDLKLDPSQQIELAETLDEYELELDLAVQARLRVADQGDGILGGNVGDLEGIQKRMPEVRDTASRLREINYRHARKIEPILPPDKAAVFAAAVRRHAFPLVYRESTAAKHLNAADGFNDLDATQREALADLKAQYERELAAANEAWCVAIERSEAKPGAILGPAAQVIWKEEDAEIVEAKRVRRQTDERARKKLASILRPEQQERLPKPELERDIAGGAAVIVR